MSEAEYNECVTSLADNIYRFAVKHLRNEEDARDIVQTSFERLWVNRSSVNVVTSKSYLFTIAYHLLIDHVRKHKRIDLKDSFDETAYVTYPQNNGKKAIEMAFEQLNDLQKSLVLLKDYEGYSYEEIGKITGLNSSQVKVYLHRARTRLKEFIVRPENVI